MFVSFHVMAVIAPAVSASSSPIKRHFDHCQRPAKARPWFKSKAEEPLAANELNPFRRPRFHTGQEVHRSSQPVRASNSKSRQRVGVFVNPELLFLRSETHANVLWLKPFD